MAAQKKPKKPAKSCGCVAKINKALEPENVMLDTIWFITGKVYPQIQVMKRDPKGPKPKKLIPIYCPFCGKKYPK